MNTELRVGIAGVGAIGRTHIDRITHALQGARVVGVTDVAKEHGKAVAAAYNLPFYEHPGGLLAEGGADALIVASSDQHHAEHVLAAIEAGKPVLCEKPLSPDAAGCRGIIEAEMRGGRKLVQVGFMRRYDPGYRELKKAVEGGKYGAPLMLHCAHRNYSVPETFTSHMSICNSLIHEIDVLRWLIGEDYEWVDVVIPKSTKNAPPILRDPMVLNLYSKSGVYMNVECFVNNRVGYDIQCEICFEEGFVRLPDLSTPHILVDAARVTPICRDWSERFVEAYNVEIQEWINTSREGRTAGPSAWDGYVACITSDCAQQARESGARVKVALPDKPTFYI